MIRAIGRKKEEATPRVSGACSHGKLRLLNCVAPGMLVARLPLAMGAGSPAPFEGTG